MDIIVAANKAQSGVECAKRVLKAAELAVAERDRFFIGFSGGSLPQTFADGLKILQEEDEENEEVKSSTVDWSKWHVFYCDERCVPHDHADSNHKLVVDSFLSLDFVTVPESQVYPIDSDALERGGPVEAAKSYELTLCTVFGSSDVIFDVLLLGMGPDGHTCSLFPDHTLLEERNLLVAPIVDSPKPPPQRITLTFPIINAARVSIFLATGAGKKERLMQVFQKDKDKEKEKGNRRSLLPVERVQSKKVVWIVDQDAAPDGVKK